MRIFGLNSWSILVPQALEGVAAVALLYAAVRRVSGADGRAARRRGAGDHPGGGADVPLRQPGRAARPADDRGGLRHRAGDRAGRPRWLVLAGALVGFAFLTKMLQGLLVVPALRGRLPGRGADGAAARASCTCSPARRAMVVAAGWWIALVELWPAGSRPYIGGSTNNSDPRADLRLQRRRPADRRRQQRQRRRRHRRLLLRPDRPGRGCSAREMGTQISWLLPAALVALGALVWLTCAPPAHRRRCAPARSSGAAGCWSPAWCSASPAASSTRTTRWRWRRRSPRWSASASVELWRARATDVARWVLAGARRRRRLVDVRPARPRVAGTRSCAGSCCSPARPRSSRCSSAAPGRGAVGRRAARRADAAARARRRTRCRRRRPRTPARCRPPGPATARRLRRRRRRRRPGGVPAAAPAAGAAAGGAPARRRRLRPAPAGATRRRHGRPARRPRRRRGRRQGGLGGATTVSAALTTALQADAVSYTWVAATTSDNEAASLELATGEPVMSLGGYNGTDRAITLARSSSSSPPGKIHYYVADQQGFIGSTAANTSTAYAIQQWVTSTFTATTVGGTTVYDLTAAVLISTPTSVTRRPASGRPPNRSATDDAASSRGSGRRRSAGRRPRCSRRGS